MQAIIEGRPAMLSFLNDQFESVERSQATMLKATDAVGSVVFLTRSNGKAAAMPMKPHKDESQSDFMARCVPEMIGTGKDKRPQEQAVAICMNIWRKKDKSVARQTETDLEPDPDESYQDWMDRCGEETDEAECQMIWDNRSAKQIVRKTHVSAGEGLEFILSDATLDRMGDVIEAEGWDLTDFEKHPVALFNHNNNFPIGKWKNLRIENGALRGFLQLAKKGTSERINEIISLVEQDILRAVSVGFSAVESEPLNKSGRGTRFKRMKLIETSLVAVPANPNALAIAKSLKTSPATIDLVFAEHGTNGRIERRGLTGEHASSSRNYGKGSAMSGLAQRIMDLETQIVAKRDALEEHLEQMDDSNVSDSDLEVNDRLNDDIKQLEKTRESLVNSEKVLSRSANGGGDNMRSRALSTTVFTPDDRPASSTVPATPKKNGGDLVDFYVRAGMIALARKIWGLDEDAARQKVNRIGKPLDEEGIRVASDIVLRAASYPALTSVTGWATELVQTNWVAMMPVLYPQAIFTRLAAKGLSLSFGRAGRIQIPTRSRTATIAGSFVLEGGAIPVRQGLFQTQSLTPKKMAVITTWTKEMDDHSIPAIEGLLREAIQVDTAVAIDSVLIDANPATAIRPAGLLNGVSVTTATAGGGIAALVGDIGALIGAITANTFGNVRSLVWLANPVDMLKASLLTATNTGIFPFYDQIQAGNLNGIPLIQSSTVPLKTLILVDAADFVVVGGDAPRIDISDQATLHMEDTNPLELVASPSTVAAPQRSLFQTDSLALRMILPLNWVQRRTGTVAWTQTVTWS
jgi:HK97 family phage prohead protease